MRLKIFFLKPSTSKLLVETRCILSSYHKIYEAGKHIWKASLTEDL